MKQSTIFFSMASMLLVLALFGSHRSGKLWQEIPILFRYYGGVLERTKDFEAGDTLAGYLTIDVKDHDCARKMLYNETLLALDSVHRISSNSRIDSIWNFIRPQMAYVADLSNNTNTLSRNVIHTLPLRTGEDGLSNVQRVGEFTDARGVYSEREGLRSITIFDMEEMSFSALAVVIYHEAEHAAISVWNSELEEEVEHAQIFLTECSVVSDLMAYDSSLQKSYKSCDFKGVAECSVNTGSPFLEYPQTTKELLLCVFHGMYLLEKEGEPITTEEKVSLYRRARVVKTMNVI